MKFLDHIPAPQRMNPFDFNDLDFSSAAMKPAASYLPPVIEGQFFNNNHFKPSKNIFYERQENKHFHFGH